MPAERAGYTVTMFIVDISPSMGKTRTVELPPDPNGESRSTEMSNLEWSLQYVKLKIQEMIYNGRKTDQCGVIIFGSEDTENIINEKNGGYENVSEYISIAQPNASTISKLDELQPSSVIGDPIDALIVAIETQNDYLSSKKTWTRKVTLITDGENPIEIEDWQATVKKMNELDIGLTIIGIDFDDEELPFHEENKSKIKVENEKFYARLNSALPSSNLGTCALALISISLPDVKQTKSTLSGTVLRLGDTLVRGEEAIEILVKTSKCTALMRPKGWKKFGKRAGVEKDADGMDVDEAEERKLAYAQLKMRTEYYVDRGSDPEATRLSGEDGEEYGEDEDDKATEQIGEILEKVEKEELIRGFKYGTTYAPCPDGQFPRLNTMKGIDICGFFPAKNFRRDLSLGEIQYIWADPSQLNQQVALSSIVQAMLTEGKEVMAIARWVTKDGMDPKMGVLSPVMFEKVDCLLWAQMPFADDVRKYTFASLDNIVTKKGEVLEKHPYIPTKEQLHAMDEFVDAMDLMEAGEKNDEGNRQPWFDTRLSYNPAVHRTKQALFHCAVVSDVLTHPIPPPHPELLKYFNPPKRILKRARDALNECIILFKVKEVPRKVAKQRKDGHVHAKDQDDDMLLLDIIKSKTAGSSQILTSPQRKPTDDSDTEDDADEDLPDATKKPPPPNLPLTPARSLSPPIDPGLAPGRIIGTTYPLTDFKKNIAQGDVVTKAVEDLGWVIREIVVRPFSGRRTEELLECMSVLRDTSLKEDEIDAWNAFLRNLHQTCSSEPGNKEFWAHVQKAGRDIGLISQWEAQKYGGISNVSESEANDFLQA